jgi:hypothetical protein
MHQGGRQMIEGGVVPTQGRQAEKAEGGGLEMVGETRKEYWVPGAPRLCLSAESFVGAAHRKILRWGGHLSCLVGRYWTVQMEFQSGCACLGALETRSHADGGCSGLPFLKRAQEQLKKGAESLV